MAGKERLELSTNRLTVYCANQLRYSPLDENGAIYRSQFFLCKDFFYQKCPSKFLKCGERGRW